MGRGVWLVLLLGTSACQRADIWLTPSARVELETSDHRKVIVDVSDGDRERTRYPHELHTISINAPGRASIKARCYYHEGDCDYSTRADAVCLKSEKAERHAHPLKWLRSKRGPFEIPAAGQGVIITSDVAANVTVSGGGRRIQDRVEDRGPDDQLLPVTVELPPGKYDVWVSDGTHDSYHTDVTVTPRVYEWHHVLIGRRTGSYGGSGWLR